MHDQQSLGEIFHPTVWYIMIFDSVFSRLPSTKFHHAFSVLLSELTSNVDQTKIIPSLHRGLQSSPLFQFHNAAYQWSSKSCDINYAKYQKSGQTKFRYCPLVSFHCKRQQMTDSENGGEFLTLKLSWPWHWIGSHNIPLHSTNQHVHKNQILFELNDDKKVSVDEWTIGHAYGYQTGFLWPSQSKSWPKTSITTNSRAVNKYNQTTQKITAHQLNHSDERKKRTMAHHH